MIVNLLINARDALRDGPQPDKTIEITAQGAANGRILLRGADNGPGVAAAIRDRIFEPFFTAKPNGEGTGLGLAMAFGMVRDAGGTLILKPDAQGAVFEIDLPDAPPKEAS